MESSEGSIRRYIIGGSIHNTALTTYKPPNNSPTFRELLREAKIVAGDTAEGELFGKPYFLAGGLHAGNLREAAALGSYGLDVSSGIETDGSKDFTKMVEVMELVRKF